MIWATKGGPIKLQHMDTTHIRNTLKTVKNGKGGSFCGHSTQDWIIAFKLELTRRDFIADKILSLFPKVHQEFKNIINPQNQTNRTFTTKNIKELNYVRRKTENKREVRA